MRGVSDCPVCEWEWAPQGYPQAVYPPGGGPFPLVWRGWLGVPFGADPIDESAVRSVAVASHLVACHPEHAEVQRVFAA